MQSAYFKIYSSYIVKLQQCVASLSKSKCFHTKDERCRFYIEMFVKPLKGSQSTGEIRLLASASLNPPNNS